MFEMAFCFSTIKNEFRKNIPVYSKCDASEFNANYFENLWTLIYRIYSYKKRKGFRTQTSHFLDISANDEVYTKDFERYRGVLNSFILLIRDNL